MIPKFVKALNIPHKPGVYIFKNSVGNVLYVGKAIDLLSRVSSYWNKQSFSSNKSGQTIKTAQLVSNISDLDFVIVESELEALILEANLIKKNLPPFNVSLMDDKDYLYIKITKEDFPKVITSRKQDLKYSLKFFGPFPSSTTVKSTLKSLRKVFPWCSSPPGPRNKRFKPCFYYHIGQCPGACVGKISKEDYKKIIRRFSKFLEGKKEELIDELSKGMEEDAKDLRFEEASRLKKVLEGIFYLTSPNRAANYLNDPNFLEKETHSALEDLRAKLNLPDLPERIEAYDISNFQGKESTGSLVVLTLGDIDKSQYRRFKIKISGKPNDTAMHMEMMKRRLTHPEWPLPQLILIDGGRGQARAARSELLVKNLNIPIFGLAKRREWLYPPEGALVRLPRNSLALRLLQKIRDEAHRFALKYHRKLRDKAFFEKPLTPYS